MTEWNRGRGLHALSKVAALGVINGAANFLKHADRDPDSILSFEEEENDDVMFVATLECAKLGHPLSHLMQVYQIWYLAAYPEKVGSLTEVVERSRAAMPGLNSLTRQDRLAAGRMYAGD